MQALLFEVMPRRGHESHYFDRAAALRPELEKNAGLIFIDRFKSLVRPGLILSHSLWKDEASLARWRTDPKHHAAQAARRNVHFADYRLRIAQVVGEAGGGEAQRGGTQDNAYNDPGLTACRYLVVVQSSGEPFGSGGEGFSSVNRENAFVSVVPVATRESGEETIAAAAGAGHVESAWLCLVSRDYGMFDRTEAPQYYPQAKRATC